MRKNDRFFNSWRWENEIVTYKQTKFDPYLIPLTKINSKWVKNLNVGPETIELQKNYKNGFLTLVLATIFFSNFYIYFILLYNTVLVLPYIDMNPPRVYMRSQT